MNPVKVKAWIEALRSGKYVQGRYYLRQPDGTEGHKHCCLGVLAEVEMDSGNEGICWFETEGRTELIEPSHKGCDYISPELAKEYGIQNLGDFAHWNDTSTEEHKNFLQIADYIEKEILNGTE